VPAGTSGGPLGQPEGRAGEGRGGTRETKEKERERKRERERERERPPFSEKRYAILEFLLFAAARASFQ